MYGVAVIDISNVRHCVKIFRNGKREIADKPKSGCSITSVADANQERADKFIRGHRCITVQNVSDALNVSYDSSQ